MFAKTIRDIKLMYCNKSVNKWTYRTAKMDYHCISKTGVFIINKIFLLSFKGKKF